jgi:hypothetical protein
MDRQHIEEMLGEIEAALPLLLAEADDPRDFWSAFADEANHVSGIVEMPEDKDFVRECLNRMLRERGFLKTTADVAIQRPRSISSQLDLSMNG